MENPSIKATEASPDEIGKPIWWIDLGWQQGAHQAALLLLLLSRTGRKWDGKPGGQHKGNLIKKCKDCTWKPQKTKIYSLLSIIRQCPVAAAVTLGEKCLNNEWPPHSSFLLGFSAEHIIRYEISLWSAWIRCLGYVPSQSLAHPHLTGLWRDGNGMERQSCSVVLKTLVCHVFDTVLAANTKHSTGMAAMGKLTPSQTNQIQHKNTKPPNCKTLFSPFYFQELLIILHNHKKHIIKVILLCRINIGLNQIY